jgi:hypothetical protein
MRNRSIAIFPPDKYGRGSALPVTPQHGEVTVSLRHEPQACIRPPDESRAFRDQLAGSVVKHLGGRAGQCLRREGGSDGNRRLARRAFWICVVMAVFVRLGSDFI